MGDLLRMKRMLLILFFRYQKILREVTLMDQDFLLVIHTSQPVLWLSILENDLSVRQKVSIIAFSTR